MELRDAVTSRIEATENITVGKVKRLVGYGAIGATGIPIDLILVEALIRLGLHHLLAITVAYQTAMTWNFALQRKFVYGVSGNVVRQYIRYLTVDVSAFVVRAGVVIATVDLASPWLALPFVPGHIAPAVPASFIGILLAFLIGFQGTDTVVFGRYTDS